MAIPISVVFRVDASNEIGTGHFMRCFTLAQELSTRKALIHFISRYLPEYFADKLKESGFRLTRLPNGNKVYNKELAHSSWLGVTQETDANQTLLALSQKVKLIVVDHYAISASWESLLRAKAEKIMVIDDLADRLHDCDFLLDQNLFKNASERYRKYIPSSCITLFGPEYALLRNEFLIFRQKVTIRSAPVKRLLVLMGGVDQYNITSKVLYALKYSEKSLAVDVIIGNQHPAVDMVREICVANSYTLYIQPSNIAALMANADISVGSAGSTSWERCALGLPSICFTQAENQIPIAENLEQAEIIINGGDGIVISESGIQQIIEDLLNDPQKISALSSKAMKLVDAIGAKKVTDLIINAD
jgi:UDP-2,4-diacetamido-2,4,6-trideoxy-beta-L-altropyranose hydrolase